MEINFTPNLSNFCKLILIFLHRGFFPDYFLYPSSNVRIEQISTLYRMVRMDYVKIMVVPFSANNYYSNMEFIKELDSTIPELVYKKSVKKARSDMISHIYEE
ncbi:hypothetical protein DDB_G0275907 [Dictyostelium discoideum AX4]|uniref:Uncharacterized protein n=1 Tax=Dictyostelium discoideum TaxID=44689 RepID=Q552U3_DICDI|nr:hypothetical protein DDB_G0275907 [Dictyostelium discoideum AX4]EAL69704.1 hypothetical protein DDB_G0275907 [Dictyostelium discoideum AX4]|eukprot:XP_643588.1 hypothetical protein DDB_G0275907 [Dictyostelium discoideum AX4]